MDYESVQRILALENWSMEEQVEDSRSYAKEDLALFYPLLDDRLDQFFRTHPKARFPAIDIASGRGSYVEKMALHYRPPAFEKELIWYATDSAGHPEDSSGGPIEKETRATLRYCLEESKEKMESALFTDIDDEVVYKGDAVSLFGLKSIPYNDKRGHARGLDPKVEGHITVQVSVDPSDEKSFSQQNVRYAGESSMDDAVLRHLRTTGLYEKFYQGLLNRTREIDILEKKTWTNAQGLEAKCALVTCSRLLACHRDPPAWQDTMEFASRFLCKGGYLLQYDAIDHAGFGDEVVMKEFIKKKSLGLILEDTIDEKKETAYGQVLKGYLWEKV